MKLKLYTDGGARNNPGPGAIGILLCNEQDEELIQHKDFIGESTNNIAEYCALLAGLEIALQFKCEHLECFLDSELIVRQLTGAYKVKNPHIKKLFREIKQKESHFTHISYNHVERAHEKMKIVDKLVNQVLNEQG